VPKSFIPFDCFSDNRSLQCFSVAMQSFTFALWKMHCVHRYSCGNNHGVKNITPLRGGKRCSLFVVREIDLTPYPSPDMRGERQLGSFFVGLKSPLSGEI
jgi:hypothetical protein